MKFALIGKMEEFMVDLTEANDFLENLESSRGTCKIQRVSYIQTQSLISLPRVIRRPVLQVSDQGYRSEDIKLAGHEPEYPR